MMYNSEIFTIVFVKFFWQNYIFLISLNPMLILNLFPY